MAPMNHAGLGGNQDGVARVTVHDLNHPAAAAARTSIIYNIAPASLNKTQHKNTTGACYE